MQVQSTTGLRFRIIPVRNSLDYAPNDVARNKGPERPPKYDSVATYRGPLRKVTNLTVLHQDDPIGETWLLELDCGHEVLRTTKGQTRWARCTRWCRGMSHRALR